MVNPSPFEGATNDRRANDLRLWKTFAASRRSKNCCSPASLAVARSSTSTESFSVKQMEKRRVPVFFCDVFGDCCGRSKHIMKQTFQKNKSKYTKTCFKNRNDGVVSLSNLGYNIPQSLSRWWVAYSNTIKLHLLWRSTKPRKRRLKYWQYICLISSWS